MNTVNPLMQIRAHIAGRLNPDLDPETRTKTLNL
jgi:hypothetical protein